METPASPVALRSERALLGAVLLDARLVQPAREIIEPADFHRSDHGTIYKAVITLVERLSSHDIDTTAVVDELERSNELERVGGEEYLRQLINDAGASENAIAFAKNIRDASLRRELLGFSRDVADVVQAPGDKSGAELLEEVQRKVLDLDQRGLGDSYPRAAKEILVPLIDEIEKRSRGEEDPYIPTGLKDLDNIILGLQPQALLVLAARPGMGKTAMALSIVSNVCTQDPDMTVLMFSLEMSSQELMSRLVSTRSGVNHSRLRDSRSLTQANWKDIHSVQSGIQDSGLYIDDTPALTPENMHSRVFRMRTEASLRNSKLGLVVVDYIQLMRAPGYANNRVAEISDISRSLKEIARTFNVPVLALSQLNRQVESRRPPIPNLSDLRESGSIEQDADTVMLLYRQDEYEREKAEDAGTMGVTDIRIAKQRNGRTGNIQVFFDKDRVAYKDYLNKDSDDIGA